MVVGILANVLALSLVGVVLYTDAQYSKAFLQKLTNMIKQMAKVDQVSQADIVKEFGSPQHQWATENDWIGRWNVTLEDPVNTSDVMFQITIAPMLHEISDGKHVYRVDIEVVQTWRSGLKYLQTNLARVLVTGSLFLFKPHSEVEGVRLVLPLPARKQVNKIQSDKRNSQP